MTQRKPPGKKWESWVEEQIQDAGNEGEFDDLEGKGQPIAGLDAPYDPLWWIKKLMARENLSVLPPALEVRAKVERALEALARLPSEKQVRDLVAALNAEIGRANRTTIAGPPTSLAPLQIDVVVAEWKRRRTDV